MEKNISDCPLCTDDRIELSPKEGWTCWKQDGKDKNLQHIHPAQTSNVEKIIMEIPAKTYLSNIFLYYWIFVLWTNETVLQGWFFFFQS